MATPAASLHREPNNSGDAQENKSADREIDVGLLHAEKS